MNDLFLHHLFQSQQPNMLLNLLLHQQPQQSIGLPNLQSIPQLVAPPAPALPAQPSSATSSPVKALPRFVSLDEFCLFYSVPADTEEKLKRLEVIPGDVKGIRSLERQDWSGEGGFSKLGWDRFKDLHARFMRDIRDGAFA
jgi:hypothetical protein